MKTEVDIRATVTHDGSLDEAKIARAIALAIEDTFTHAAVELLEHNGYGLLVPTKRLAPFREAAAKPISAICENDAHDDCTIEACRCECHEEEV